MQSLTLCTLLVAAGATLGSGLLYSGAPLAGLGYPGALASPLHYGAALQYGAPLQYAGAPLQYAGALQHGAPLQYAGAALATSTLSQSHAQDELGQYKFGYNAGTSARDEVRTADGVVRGSYSYIDAYGIPQKVAYVADALGYRTVGTNLPVATL